MNKKNNKIICIIGLGNPDEKYNYTKHNVGANFIDYLIQKLNIKYLKDKSNLFLYSKIKYSSSTYVLIKSQSYMNLSGEMVKQAINYFQPEKSFIVFDDLDLVQGSFKIQLGKFPKSHNGIKNIILNVDNYKNLFYVRIGIENRSKEEKHKIPGKFFVLEKSNFNFQSVYEQIYKKIFLGV